MASTNKTKRLNLTQYIGTDIISFLDDYNIDMSKIDVHGHVVISSTQPKDLPDDGSVLWYDTTNGLLMININGKVVPIVTISDTLDDKNPNHVLSATAGELLKTTLDNKSTIYESDKEHGTLPKPTNLILKITKGSTTVTGYTENMVVSPNMGIRLLTPEEEGELKPVANKPNSTVSTSTTPAAEASTVDPLILRGGN